MSIYPLSLPLPLPPPPPLPRLVSCDIVLMRTNVVNLLNVCECPRARLSDFFRATQNEMQTSLCFSDITLTLTPNRTPNHTPNPNYNPNRTPNHNPNPNHTRTPNPNRTPNRIQNAFLYISFCVARKKSDNRALGHDSIDE